MRNAIVRSLEREQLLALYEGLIRNRLHDIGLKRWVKQGVISKAWLGTGEEAVTIGSVHALDRRRLADGYSTDFVAPMIRNAGACHEMGMPVADMLRAYLGTYDTITRGRDLHTGDPAHGVIAAKRRPAAQNATIAITTVRNTAFAALTRSFSRPSASQVRKPTHRTRYRFGIRVASDEPPVEPVRHNRRRATSKEWIADEIAH